MQSDPVTPESTSSTAPALVVTIDTEEEGLWSGNYAETGTVANIRGVPRFQQLCDGFNIRPTYLVDAPVVESQEAVSILRPLQDHGRAEIGAHLHPWNTPPKFPQNSKSDSFLCNLPPAVQREKLQWLTEAITTRFGRPPISFRAGRYGMGTAGLNILRELGYRVDSSVLPYTDYSAQQGPDYSAVGPEPYFPSMLSMLDASEDTGLLEVPVTVGFTHRFFNPANRLRTLAARKPLRKLRAVGMLDRTGIAQKVKLSPEQASLDQMKKLACAVIARGTPVLVLMFHSSSLKPGCSPYVSSDSDLQAFLRRLESFYTFCLSELECVPQTLGECFARRKRLTAGGRR